MSIEQAFPVHFYHRSPRVIAYPSVCVEKRVVVPAFQGLNSHRSEINEHSDNSQNTMRDQQHGNIGDISRWLHADRNNDDPRLIDGSGISGNTEVWLSKHNL